MSGLERPFSASIVDGGCVVQTRTIVGLGGTLLLLVFGQNFDFSYSQNMPVAASFGATPGSYTMEVPQNDLTDFLIQDVCVDQFDRPLAQDPISCVRRRDLRIGEDLPYAKYAARGWGAGTAFSMQNSYPVWGGDFVRVVRTMNQNGANSGRDYNVKDGYDIIENEGAYE